jgi:hypothetical protein
MNKLQQYWQVSTEQKNAMRSVHNAKTEGEHFDEILDEVRAEHPELGEDALTDIVTEVAEFKNHKGYTGLLRLEAPARCHIGTFGDEIQCENMTQWSYNGYPLCQDHLKQMADMNSDNYEAVKLALASTNR